jgi:hypothetical protein
MLGPMQRSTAAILRAHFVSHNLSVLAASGVALLFAAIGWLALYAVTYWTTLFTLSIGRHGAVGLPASFHTVFFSCAGVSLVFAALDIWFFPHDFVPDERPALETLADILLFLPRITLSVFWNLAAWVRLRSADRADAIAILDQLRVSGKIPMHELPVAIPDPASRDRILRTFHMTEITHIRREKNVAWLRLSPLAPKDLRAKLLPDDTDDNLTRMRRVTVLKHKHALPGPKRQLPPYNRDDL